MNTPLLRHPASIFRRCSLSWRRLAAIAVLAGGAAAAPVHAQPLLASIESMKKMSLEELLGLQVTTMSRKEELWWAAPGAIEVVTNEEIRRSTAQNIPEALRLATGIDVAQPSARSWAISARGFNVLAANKISVLLDGRSLFTPFFSGVQWDAQDTMLDDIDRIEVVRGPVGALWGSFAVNGFVQIVTKSARDTQGTLVSAGAGTEDPGFVAVRHGGRIGRQTYYRAYAKYFKTDWTYLADGRQAQPPTDFFQTGFRVDTKIDRDTNVTLQGDAYTNKGTPEDHLQGEVSGANALARVTRALDGGADLDVLAYFDHTRRFIPLNWMETRNTAALNIKHRRPTGAHDLLFGIDANVSRDHIEQIGVATMDPPRRTTHTVAAYLQDTWTLSPGLTAVTVAGKIEHNAFTGFEYHPSVRAAWTPSHDTTWWAAVSRAVRPPVRVDHDLLFDLGGTPVVQATDDFRAETALAYEIGWRQRLGETATVDVATFYNEYDHLRTTEPLGAAPLPSSSASNDNVTSSSRTGPSARVMRRTRLPARSSASSSAVVPKTGRASRNLRDATRAWCTESSSPSCAAGMARSNDTSRWRSSATERAECSMLRFL